MDLTAPQKRLLAENREPTIRDYMRAIRRKPAALEIYLDKAKKAGFSTGDLKSLLGFALKNEIINMQKYRYLEGQLELAKTRKMRKTGRMDSRDTAIRQDDDDEMSVKCVKCKQNVRADQANLIPDLGWSCPRCK